MDDVTKARHLFNVGFNRKEIAEILHKNEKTIGSWAEEGDWERRRAEFTLNRETAEERIWKLINYQLKVHERIVEAQDAALETTATTADLKKLLLERGDIDALQKLFTTIKGKELEWTAIVKLIRDFVEYIDTQNQPLSKQILSYANEFINDKRSD